MAGKNRRLMTNRNNIFFYIFFVLFLFTNGFSQSNYNFLILENPFELTIYNKYEQNLSFKDSSYFLKYCLLLGASTFQENILGGEYV